MFEKSANIFERSAHIYDAYYRFLDYPAASRQLYALIQQLNPNAKTLLDVACGTGKHLECLREQVYGLPVSA